MSACVYTRLTSTGDMNNGIHPTHDDVSVVRNIDFGITTFRTRFFCIALKMKTRNENVSVRGVRCVRTNPLAHLITD